MWKKSMLVLLGSAFAFFITYSASNLVALADDNIKQNYLKLMYENKILYHEKVPTETKIQVLNAGGEVLQSEVLSGDTEMELDAPKIGKGKMLSYWHIEKQEDKMIIQPYLLEEKELSVRFYTTDGGKLLENNAQIKEIVKSVNKATNLKDVLPEVNPKNNHKFSGWFKVISENSEEKLKDIDDLKIKDSKGVYYAKFYPDYNDNDIDDQTEEIAIKFVTNSKQKFKDINTKVGLQIELPKLKKSGFIFMGWYTDEEYKNKFTDEVFTKSLTLYAKWDKTEKVVTESGQKPITDKGVSDQVERALNNPVTQTPSNPTSGSGLTVVPSPPSNQGNTNASNSFKETIYVFENLNLGETFMVKFFDEDGGFLFSHAFPYGKTIKTYDEKEKLREEFAVRQDTTITLNTKDYINKDSTLLGFKSREVRVNSMQVTEVYPEVKFKENENLAQEYAKTMEEEYLAAQKKSTTIFTILTLFLVSIAGISIYLFMKRRKKRNHEQIQESI